MIKILTITNEYDSVAKLGFECRTCFDGRVENFNNDIIIRWGNSSLLLNKSGEEQDFKNIINKAKFISFNCKKNLSLQKLSQVVNTPKIFTTKVPEKTVVVYRPIYHTGGEGFSVFEGPLDIQHEYYATEWIETTKEYRVWFCGNRFLMAKRFTENKCKLQAKYPCRSSYQYKFYKKVPEELKKEVLIGAKTLNLLFGAADILRKNKKYYFCEYNSAPSLDDNKLVTFYKEELLKLVTELFSNKI